MLAQPANQERQPPVVEMTSETFPANYKQAATEAANRAEATALLIRCGYRVYRPEADIEGEDLVLRLPSGELTGVQLKSRPLVDWPRYGGRKLWMLFPDRAFTPDAPRSWFLIPHDEFFAWVEARHKPAAGWAGHWSYPHVSKALRAFLASYEVRPEAEPTLTIDGAENSN